MNHKITKIKILQITSVESQGTYKIKYNTKYQNLTNYLKLSELLETRSKN